MNCYDAEAWGGGKDTLYLDGNGDNCVEMYTHLQIYQFHWYSGYIVLLIAYINKLILILKIQQVKLFFSQNTHMNTF